MSFGSLYLVSISSSNSSSALDIFFAPQADSDTFKKSVIADDIILSSFLSVS